MKGTVFVIESNLDAFKKFAKENNVKIVKIEKQDKRKKLIVSYETSSNIHVGFWKGSGSTSCFKCL